MTVNVPSLLCLLGRLTDVSQRRRTPFVRLLAKAKTRSTPEQLRTRVRQSWMFRWGSLLASAAAKAFASSLLDRRGHSGTDVTTPSDAEVLADFSRAPLVVG